MRMEQSPLGIGQGGSVGLSDEGLVHGVPSLKRIGEGYKIPKNRAREVI